MNLPVNGKTPSLLSALIAKRQHMRAEIAQDEHNAATKLRQKIPAHARSFFEKLDHIVPNLVQSGRAYFMCHSDECGQYDCENLDDLQELLRAIKRAWDGEVDVRISGTPTQITAEFVHA